METSVRPLEERRESSRTVQMNPTACCSGSPLKAASLSERTESIEPDPVHNPIATAKNAPPPADDRP